MYRAVVSEKDPTVIPRNEYYCYDHVANDGEEYVNVYEHVTIPGSRRKSNLFPLVGVCPYWSVTQRDGTYPDGHCSFLGVKDSDYKKDEAGYLLWDLIKRCHVKTRPEVDKKESE